MDMLEGESTLAMLTPGPAVDVLYPSKDNSAKAAFPTTVNTRYSQAFSNLTGGTSVFTLPPGHGLTDIVLALQLPDLTGNSAGLAVNTAWAYALIKQVSYRIGGSSQFFITGQQMLQDALKSAGDSMAKQAIYDLGGSQLQVAGLNSANNWGYVFLSLPFSAPSAVGKPCPLPADALTSQIQITVELNPVSSIFSNNNGGALPGACATLQSAQAIFQQVVLENAGDSIARRVDLRTHTLNYPCKFLQQQISIPCANTANSQTVALTGFKSGRVRSIECWLSRTGDAPAGTASPVTKNLLKWYPIYDAKITYGGDVYANYVRDSGALWNVVNNRVPANVNATELGAFAAGAYATSAATYPWLSLPFAQPMVTDESSKSVLVEGKPILNAIVNLEFKTPTAAADYVLNVQYVYDSVLVFNSGSCEFAF